MRPLPAAIRASTSSWIVAAPRTPALLWRAGDRRHTNAVSRWLDALTETDGTLACDPGKVEALVSAWPISSRRYPPPDWGVAPVHAVVRPVLRAGSVCAQRHAAFLAEVKDGTVNFDLLHQPAALSRDGMLHLAR